MEKLNINEPIAYDCDEAQDKPMKFTVDDGNYALTAWNVELSKSKAGNPLLNIRFGINGHGFDAHFATGPDNSQGYFTTVGN